jgi:hypothetical protein
MDGTQKASEPALASIRRDDGLPSSLFDLVATIRGLCYNAFVNNVIDSGYPFIRNAGISNDTCRSHRRYRLYWR